MWAKQKGFTLVELAIVIAVVAILAIISVVAYGGVQKRAQDSNTRMTAEQIVKATQTWAISSGKKPDIGGNGSAVYSGGPCVGGGGGWFVKGIYPCSMDQVLVGAGAISSSLTTSVPSANKKFTGAHTNFMLYRCGGSGDWVFMYALHTDDTKEITRIKTVCAGSPSATFGPIDTYGMTGGIIFSPSGGKR